MYEYSSNLGKCALVHITIDEESQISDLKAREICSYLRGTTWAAPALLQPFLKSIKANSVAYSKPVVYLNTTDSAFVMQKQIVEGFYSDEMQEHARKSYLPYELSTAKTPLEVVSLAAQNAQSFGLVHVLPHLKEIINKSITTEDYNSVIVFINCFDNIPEFIDVNISLC
jgi:hypothetical protein